MAVKWRGKEAADEFNRRCHVMLMAIAERLLENANDEVPVDTGALRDSGEMIELSSTTIIVAYTAPHAKYVEFGTKTHYPNGFLRRAILTTIPEAETILKG